MSYRAGIIIAIGSLGVFVLLEVISGMNSPALSLIAASGLIILAAASMSASFFVQNKKAFKVPGTDIPTAAIMVRKGEGKWKMAEKITADSVEELKQLCIGKGVPLEEA